MHLYDTKKLSLPFENYFSYISQRNTYLTLGVSADAMLFPKFSNSKLYHIFFKLQGAKNGIAF